MNVLFVQLLGLITYLLSLVSVLLLSIFCEPLFRAVSWLYAAIFIKAGVQMISHRPW